MDPDVSPANISTVPKLSISIHLVNRDAASCGENSTLCPDNVSCCPSDHICAANSLCLQGGDTSPDTCNGHAGYFECPLSAGNLPKFITCDRAPTKGFLGPGSCCPVGTVCASGGRCELPVTTISDAPSGGSTVFTSTVTVLGVPMTAAPGNGGELTKAQIGGIVGGGVGIRCSAGCCRVAAYETIERGDAGHKDTARTRKSGHRRRCECAGGPGRENDRHVRCWRAAVGILGSSLPRSVPRHEARADREL
jgi:hypothetical protein